MRKSFHVIEVRFEQLIVEDLNTQKQIEKKKKWMYCKRRPTVKKEQKRSKTNIERIRKLFGNHT